EVVAGLKELGQHPEVGVELIHELQRRRDVFFILEELRGVLDQADLEHGPMIQKKVRLPGSEADFFTARPCEGRYASRPGSAHPESRLLNDSLSGIQPGRGMNPYLDLSVDH